jgi:hypothetical protein
MGTFAPIGDPAADPNVPYSDGDIAKAKSDAVEAGGELIAGKFKTYADLEKGYQELYQRYRNRRGQSEDPLDDDDSPDDLAPAPDVTREDEGEEEPDDEGGLSDEDVAEIAAEFGGQERISEMAAWAANTYSEKEIDKYNSLIGSGDPDIVRGAIAALERRFEKANGKAQKTNTRKTRSNLDGPAPTFRQEERGYKSYAEFERDLADPRYQDDAAFNEKVVMKVALSPHIFNNRRLT